MGFRFRCAGLTRAFVGRWFAGLVSAGHGAAVGSNTECVSLHIFRDVLAEGRAVERSDRHHRQDGGVISITYFHLFITYSHYLVPLLLEVCRHSSGRCTGYLDSLAGCASALGYMQSPSSYDGGTFGTRM